MSGDREIVDLDNLTAAVALLDRWIDYAQSLEVTIERLQRQYNAAHERCEQLREIVAKDYPPIPF